MEGDKRTPEGFYWIDWRKTSNNFNLAMHISYPNITDSARARREGVAPGGMIMIHGTPDTEEHPGRPVPHPGLDRRLRGHAQQGHA